MYWVSHIREISKTIALSLNILRDDSFCIGHSIKLFCFVPHCLKVWDLVQKKKTFEILMPHQTVIHYF